MLRAYDKTNGKEVGAVYMPAQQSGTPMTYALNGRQFIVVPDQRRRIIQASISRLHYRHAEIQT